MFDLRISFTGLCLFVPSPDGNELFVVLPAVSGIKMQGGRAIPTHRASVFFNSAYETGAAAPSASFREVLLSGSILLPQHKVKSTRTPKITAQTLELAKILDVADAAYPPPNQTVGENRNINRKSLSPGRNVVAVIAIRGGRLLSYSASYPWFLPNRPNEPRVLAWKVDWLVPGIRAATLPLSWLGGTRTDGELTPIGSAIELRVKNVPLNESTPEDVPYQRAGSMPGNHSTAFYRLLKGHPADTDTPTFGAPKVSRDNRGGLITCTPGMGTLGT